ncbi:MAG: hypothetical protein HY882_04025 [Deltaproteobacteria bacterium]|nr:hypothetical protein [Deltaproteobacteria bacterium]
MEFPEKYPWNGHLSYLGKVKDDLVPADLVLSQFGKNRSLAHRRYQQFVLDGLTAGHQEKYYKVKDQRYLGEDEFVEKIEGLRKSHEPAYWEIPLAEIVREVVNGMRIPQD